MIHNQDGVLGMLTYLLLSEWIWKEWTSMSELAVTGNSFNSMYITRLTIYMLQVKNKFKLKFLNQVDTIFPLTPIPNYHKLGNWESTEV